jgi:hypothetical protein
MKAGNFCMPVLHAFGFDDVACKVLGNNNPYSIIQARSSRFPPSLSVTHILTVLILPLSFQALFKALATQRSPRSISFTTGSRSVSTLLPCFHIAHLHFLLFLLPSLSDCSKSIILLLICHRNQLLKK